MPSIVANGTSIALDRPSGAHVFDQRAEGFEAELRGVAVARGLRVDPLLRITDGGVRQAHAPVEPGAAAEAADDRDSDRADDRRARDGPRVPEIEDRGAGVL